jgi:hypothetical protein
MTSLEFLELISIVNLMKQWRVRKNSRFSLKRLQVDFPQSKTVKWTVARSVAGVGGAAGETPKIVLSLAALSAPSSPDAAVLLSEKLLPSLQSTS